MSFCRAISEYGSLVLLSGNLPYSTEVASVRIMSSIEGDKLTVTVEGDKAKTSTVLKLTDETLEFKTESGKTTTLSRLKAK